MTGPRRGHVKGVRISALGVYVPERVLTNDELSRTIDTSDEWIASRTGIRERRIAAPEQACSDLAIKAAEAALTSSGIAAADIDLVIVSTITPDMLFPATACIVADAIGATRAGGFDLEAGCTGFVYGLAVASGLVAAGIYTNVMVVGAEVLSRVVDWEDRRTCVLFGDGAGAVVVSPSEVDSVFTFDLGSDGAGADFLLVPAGGSRRPATHATVDAHEHTMRMIGPEVYKFATRVVVESCEKVLGEAGVSPADIDLFVPHQANLRIIETAARRIGFSPEQVFTNIDRYGNTSCASIPLCLAEAVENGRLKKGDTLLMAGFGAGLTWGSCLTRWEL